MPDVATPTGGAEGSARPLKPATAQAQQTQQQPSERNDKPPTMQERLRASMFAGDEPQPDAGRAPVKQATDEGLAEEPAATQQSAPKVAPDGEADTAADPSADPSAAVDTAADEDTQAAFSTFSELAEGLGWDLDKVMDLEAPTKINGKDGKVRLRDLVKSYQLEGHLNQGLMKLAEERKGFEAETGRKVGEFQARVGQLNQAVGLAQKMLDGEFADTNWQELQRTDPAAFQAKYGAYKMRQDGIQQLNTQVQQEAERVQAQQKADYASYLDEQGKLLDSKLPEWADKGKREKDVTDMVSILNESYGLTEQEVRGTGDHRLILLARDAMRWQKLQKSKPATLNKVRAAPKLIRPGTQQSRTAQDGLDFQKGRENLRRTGKVSDATPLLKKLLFN